MLIVKYQDKLTGHIFEAPMPSLSVAKQTAAITDNVILSVTRPASNGWPAMTFTTFK